MVCIGSGPGRVDLSRGEDGRLTATLSAPGLTASHHVHPHYADDGYSDLADFVTGMERDWRGWSGDRDWRSLEAELALSARHTGSHVLLRAELRNGPYIEDGEWAVRIELRIAAGEELSRIADDVRRELGQPSAK